MVDRRAEDLEAQGHAALTGGDHVGARAAFDAALQQRESPEVLFGLAQAIHLSGDCHQAGTLYDRAFQAYRASGQPLAAARVARIRAYQCHLDGDWTLAGGWLARARRLVTDHGRSDGVEHQWLELFDTMADGDVPRRERRLRAVTAAAGRLGDANLECDALGMLGQLCVAVGRVEEGMALLDEALTAVCAGEVDEWVVVEGAFCLMLSACEITQDVPRAQRWVRSGDAIVAGRGVTSVGALCRGYYGGILLAAGRYPEAERTLVEAIRGLQDGYDLARRNALARLADVRVRQGRLEGAAQLLDGLEEHADAAHPLAALHLARGEHAMARERIQRALPSSTGVTAARLQALLVEVHLAEGDLAAAGAVAEQLADQGQQAGTPHLRGTVALTRGRVAHVATPADAVTWLRQAVTAFADAGMPLELAMSRLEMARAVAATQPEVAVAEATAALRTFEELDAARLTDQAAALLRQLGAPVRVGPKGVGALTKREEEVLGLLGHGLSNPEIAERLVISRKTVEHHVGRVLMKLGLRNRAEAAVLAARRSEVV